MASVRRLVGLQGCHQNCARSEIMHRLNRVARLAQRPAGAPAEVIQLELVGRDDIGGRHRLVPHEFRNALAYENAAANIADHRIAAIFRTRIGAS